MLCSVQAGSTLISALNHIKLIFCVWFFPMVSAKWMDSAGSVSDSACFYSCRFRQCTASINSETLIIRDQKQNESRHNKMYIQIVTVLVFSPLHSQNSSIRKNIHTNQQSTVIDCVQYRIIPCYKTGSDLISAYKK